MRYRVTFPVKFFLYDAKKGLEEWEFPPGMYVMIDKPHPLSIFEKDAGKWICLEDTLIGMCHRALNTLATRGPKELRVKIEKIPESNPTKQKE